MVDLRVLGADAAAACRAARRDRRLRFAPLVAVVPEQEAARLDLSLGFDDLALAPYRLSDLAARLRLLRWRQQQNAAASGEVIRAGRLALNPATYQVTIAGGAGFQPAAVDLTLKEYQLLLFLLRNPNRVFERSELLDRVWGGDYYGGTRTVDVHVRRIREKTSAAGDLIETMRGVGYRLVPPDRGT
jgi:DNA-binding response OmpR family regulator